MKECGAKKRDGNPCRKAGMANGRCRLHGGASLAGIASPTFVSGRYSKYLPPRMMERYVEARDDAELIDLREEVALTDTRLADLLKQVDTGESGALWAKLQGAFAQYVKLKDDPSKRLEAFAAFSLCESLIEQGLSDRFAWAEIGGLIEQRRKLVESETKRLKDLQQNITAERAMLLIRAVADVVKKHVTDPKQLAAISADLVQLTGANAGRQLDAA